MEEILEMTLPVKCNCECHRNNNIIHVVACCDNEIINKKYYINTVGWQQFFNSEYSSFKYNNEGKINS